MQRFHLLTSAALLAAALVMVKPALAADPTQIQICPSREKIEQIIQSDGHLTPDGCRMARITRVNSPAGPICQLDLGQGGQGIVGSLRDAVSDTQWWTSCANLGSPSGSADDDLLVRLLRLGSQRRLHRHASPVHGAS